MLANLRALFGVIMDIVLLRRGPEHLPVSQALLVVVAAASTVANSLLVVAMGQPFAPALLMCTVGSLVMVAWFRFLLSVVNKRERFLQTLTALFSISALFVSLLIPVLPVLAPYFATNAPAEPPPAMPTFLALAIGFWASLLEVRIVRAAFECPWVVAIMLALSEFFVSQVVVVILFGGGKPA